MKRGDIVVITKECTSNGFPGRIGKIIRKYDGWTYVRFEDEYIDGFRDYMLFKVPKDMTPEAAKLMIML